MFVFEIFAIIICLVIALGCALYDLVHMMYVKCTCEKVEGEVIGYLYVSSDRDDATSYKLRIHYQYNGKSRTHQSNDAINMWVPKHGSKQYIYVNKENDGKTYYFHYPTFWFSFAIRLFLGMLLLGSLFKG